MITAKFEQLYMNEHETITDFSAGLMNVVNEVAALGQILSDDVLVRKTLRSLPQDYNMKVFSVTDSSNFFQIKS